ncbi:MAG: hypothetical protein QMD78_06815 [Methanocellales archaeon]|nr:hypothetical protein [Methanocellales archaeon]
MSEMGYKCKCGGELRKPHTEVEFYGIDFEVRECEVCSSCGTEYLSEDIIEEIKNRGIFALERAVKITKSGNSLVLRLPPEIVKFLEIHHKSTVRLFPADKHRLEVEVLG